MGLLCVAKIHLGRPPGREVGSSEHTTKARGALGQAREEKNGWAARENGLQQCDQARGRHLGSHRHLDHVGWGRPAFPAHPESGLGPWVEAQPCQTLVLVACSAHPKSIAATSDASSGAGRGTTLDLGSAAQGGAASLSAALAGAPLQGQGEGQAASAAQVTVGGAFARASLALRPPSRGAGALAIASLALRLRPPPGVNALRLFHIVLFLLLRSLRSERLPRGERQRLHDFPVGLRPLLRLKAEPYSASSGIRTAEVLEGAARRELQLRRPAPGSGTLPAGRLGLCGHSIVAGLLPPGRGRLAGPRRGSLWHWHGAGAGQGLPRRLLPEPPQLFLCRKHAPMKERLVPRSGGVAVGTEWRRCVQGGPSCRRGLAVAPEDLDLERIPSRHLPASSHPATSIGVAPHLRRHLPGRWPGSRFRPGQGARP
mmetsp:Transcript_85775/g.190947  ORF Transcript_85775/g.190947 Transcript_85775/m.190947 type:complete len:428 (+) Transcript_85775:1622-2905(+)